MKTSSTVEIVKDTPGQGTAEERYIRFKELRTLIPLGRTTIWRMVRDGSFPKSYKIGKFATAWLRSEVLAWIQARAKRWRAPLSEVRSGQLA